MKTATYHGPCDRRRVGNMYLPKGVPTDLPDDLAEQLIDNSRVTIEGTHDEPPEV